jgi:hypothetical protein
LTTAVGPPFPDANRTGSLGLANTQIVFGNSDVATSMRSGARVMLGYWFDDERLLGVEVGGFITQRLVDRFAAASPGSPLLYRPFINATPGTPTPIGVESVEIVASAGVPGQAPTAGGFAATHTSNFLGGEANVRSNLLCNENYFLDGVVGFRYVRLNESLDLVENPTSLVPIGPVAALTTINISDQFRTTNQFYGGQLGLIGEARFGKWSVDVNGKVGLGSTVQTVNLAGATVVTNPSLPPVTFPVGFLVTDTNRGNFTRNTFSVVPEVGVSLGYQVTDHLRLFAGYDFLYWSNVVRPGNEIDRNVNLFHTAVVGLPPMPMGPARPAFAFNGSDFWAQGFHCGLEFRY